MKNTKEQISSSMLMYAIACFVICSSLLYGYIAGVTKQDSWIVVITGFIVALPIIWIFATLCEKFPGKNIIEINDIVFGKILGKIISALDVFFFFSLSFINGSIVGDFVIGSILPETPKAAILIMFLLLCVYAVRKGFENMTRYSFLFCVITIATITAAIILLLNKVNFSNLQPMLSLPIMKYVQGTHQVAIMPFSDLFVFTMIFPNLKNPQKIKKPLFRGLIIGAISMLAIFLIDILVLGPAETLVIIPSFDVIRLINIENIITRMDFFFAVVFLLLFFFKISILLYITAKGIAQIFNIKTYNILVPIVGALTVSFSLIAYDSSMESTHVRATISPAYQTFFEFILPAITLIVAVIRGFKKPKAVTDGK